MPERLWIVADEQTAGRGPPRPRVGLAEGQPSRQRPDDRSLSAAVAAQLGFVAGVALARAAKDLGATDVGLKWPNDLMFVARNAPGSSLKALVLDRGGRLASWESA